MSFRTIQTVEFVGNLWCDKTLSCIPVDINEERILKIIAHAEFTEDMAATLYKHFGVYEAQGVVSLEIASNGLWLVHPSGTRQFLGLARLSPDYVEKPSGKGIVCDPSFNA